MKYFATLGPSCCDMTILTKMKAIGVDGIRLNLSHSSLKDNDEVLKMVLEAGFKELMIDIRGAQLRHGNKEAVILHKDEDFCLKVPREMVEAYQKNPQYHHLSLDDGKIQADILAVTGDDELKCRSFNEATLLKNKGISTQLAVRLPLLSNEDIADLRLCKKYGINCIMLPFVNNRADLLAVKQQIGQYTDIDFTYYGKIESLEGCDKLADFCDLLDVVVIARGDLGNAMPLWKLPGVQKKLAAVCRQNNSDFMIVTQLLDSMQMCPKPTRAEVSDIYNAVKDGATYLMLTGETAVGKYPLEAMTYLIKTAQEALSDD